MSDEMAPKNEPQDNTIPAEVVAENIAEEDIAG